MARRAPGLFGHLYFCVLSVLVAASLSGCGGGGSISVTLVKPAATSVDPGDSVTLTANVAHDSSGVSWSMTGTGCSGSGCGALSGNTASTVVYTAPTTVTTAFSVTITATSKKDTAKTATVSFSIPVNPAITTAMGALTAGQVGSTYSVAVAIAGGISPYTWSVTAGNLPAGLTLGASTGTISGTPTTAANSTFTLQVTDSGSPALMASGQFSIAISPAPAIVFSTASLASATYNVAYTGAVTATGGAGTLSYKVSAGSLPAGLTLSSAGAITGTPTAAGTANFTVTASDAYGDSAQQNLSITVNYPAIVISPASGALPGGQYKVAYDESLTATGGSGSGYTWSVTSGASSLGAVNLSVAASGAITGTPQATGTATFAVQVKDSYGDTQTASYTIAVTYPALSIAATTLPAGMVGLSYTPVTLTASGGSGTVYTWSVANGTALSATGLTLSSGGVISGTPTTAESAATATVQVEDSASNKATATLSLTVYAALSISSATLPNATYGVAYSANLAATGGDGSSLTWSTTSGSALTAVGLSLSSAGVLSGTPPAPQNAPLPNCQSGKAYCLTLSVSVANSDNSAFTASGSVALTLVYPTLTVSTSTLPSAVDGSLYSQQLAASGGSGTGYTWSTPGTNNLSTFDLTLSGTGLLSGTPPANTTGTATFTAQVQDSFGDTATANFAVTVNGSLTITTTTLPAGTSGVLYSQTLAAAGGSGSYTWSTTGASNLSTFSLTLSSAGVLSGTPSTTGTVSFTAQVKDSNDATATQPYSFSVYTALSLPAPDPSSLPSNGFTGIGYTGFINATGGSGSYSWAVSGLSDGLSVSGGTTGSTLTIAGTPTAPASGSAPVTVTFNLTLTDTVTKASVTENGYNITISYPSAPTLPVGTSDVPGSATVNQPYFSAIGATGGVGPTYTWTLNGATAIPTATSVALGTSALASQFTITNPGGSSSVSLSGSPTSTGTVSFTLAVKDNTTSLTSSTVTYTINVNPASTIAIATTVPQAMANMPYTFAGPTISGGVAPYTVTYSNLPSWLSQPAGTWELVGTPTAAGSSTITVNATDSTTPTPQHQSATFTVTVVAEPSGSNNGALKGQYACYFQQFWPAGVTGGTGNTLYRGGAVFALAANGAGAITGGELDTNSPHSGYTGSSANGALTGTYAVGSDNRGYLVVTVQGQPGPVFAIAGGNLNSSSQFTELALTEMDDAGASPSGKTGEGHCYQQVTSGLSGTTLSGGYVWAQRGEAGDATLFGGVGSIDFGSGTFSGVMDAVSKGAYESDVTMTGNTLTAADSYGRVTFSFGPSGGTINPFVMYVTGATNGEAVVMSANPHNASSNAMFMIGEARAQVASALTAASPLSGPAVFYEAGQDSDQSGYDADLGQISSGNVELIENSEGTVQVQSLSDVTLSTNSTTGRTTVGGESGLVFYAYNTNSAAYLDASGSPSPENAIGWMEPQTAPTSGKWSVGDFETSYFSSSIPNGDQDKDFNSFVVSIGSSGAFTYYAQDDGGQGWADWGEGICPTCGAGATATYTPDTTYDPNSTIGIFDVILTANGKTLTTSYCLSIRVDQATNASSKGRAVCLDATSSSPQVSVAQQ